MDRFLVQRRAEAPMQGPMERRAPGPQSVLALLQAAARQRSRPNRAAEGALRAAPSGHDPSSCISAPDRTALGRSGSPESPIEDEDGAASAPAPSRPARAVLQGLRQRSIKWSLDAARSREHACLVTAQRREVAWLRRLDAQRHGGLAFVERRDAVRRRWATSRWSGHLRLGDGAGGDDGGRRRSMEAVRAIAPSPGGAWLAVGTRGAEVLVYSAPALRHSVRAGDTAAAAPAWYLRAARECVALRWTRRVRPDAPGGGGAALVVASALGPVSVFVLPSSSSGRERAAAMTPAARFNAAAASSAPHAAGSSAARPRSVLDVAVMPQTGGGDDATCRVAVLLSDGAVSVWEASLVGEGVTRTLECLPSKPPAQAMSLLPVEGAVDEVLVGTADGKVLRVDTSKLTPPAFGGIAAPRGLASCPLHAALAAASPPLLGREQEGRGVLSLSPTPSAAVGAAGHAQHVTALLECGASVLLHAGTLHPLLAHSHGVATALDGIRARAAAAAEPDSAGRRGGDASDPAVAAPLALSSAEQAHWGAALAATGASDGVRRSALRGLQRSRWLSSRHALLTYTEGGSVMVHSDRLVAALEFIDACPQSGAPSAVTTAAISRSTEAAEQRDSGTERAPARTAHLPVTATGLAGRRGVEPRPHAEEDSPNRSLRELANSVARDSSRRQSAPSFSSQPHKGALPLSDAVQRMEEQGARGDGGAKRGGLRGKDMASPVVGRLTALARRRLGGVKPPPAARALGGLRGGAPSTQPSAKAATLSSPEQARLLRRRMKEEARKRRSAGAGKASAPARSAAVQPTAEVATLSLRVPPSVTVVPTGGEEVRGPLTALCADPVSGWLWVGTDRGTVHCVSPQVP